MNTNQILIYGIGGADKAYQVLKYYVIFDAANSYGIIEEIWKNAERLKAQNPSINQIYVMNNRHGLRKDYMDAVRSNSIEGWMLFKDILEREAREIKF